VAAAAVAVFGLAACSSTGSDSAAVAPTTSPTPSPVATTAAALHARDYVLTAGPETTGLVVDTATDAAGGEPDISDAEIASCLGVPVSDVHGRTIDEADGPDFKTSNELTNVGSSAEIYSAADVTRDRAVLLRPQTPGCLGRISLKAFQQAASSEGGGRVTLDSAQGMTAPAGATAATRVTLTAIISGVRVHVAFDFFFLMSGRVESFVFVSQINGIPDQALEQRLVSQVAAKVARQ
jgi:hypothetical protein